LFRQASLHDWSAPLNDLRDALPAFLNAPAAATH